MWLPSLVRLRIATNGGIEAKGSTLPDQVVTAALIDDPSVLRFAPQEMIEMLLAKNTWSGHGATFVEQRWLIDMIRSNWKILNYPPYSDLPAQEQIWLNFDIVTAAIKNDVLKYHYAERYADKRYNKELARYEYKTPEGEWKESGSCGPGSAFSKAMSLRLVPRVRRLLLLPPYK